MALGAIPTNQVIRLEPFLSIAAASLGDPQILLTSTLEQCNEYRIPSELILIDHLRGNRRPSLRIPSKLGMCSVRLLEVSAEIDLGDALTGEGAVRRGHGRFMTTTAGAPLPNDLMQFLGGLHARYSSLEADDIAVNDGVLGLGKGWFWKELDGAK